MKIFVDADACPVVDIVEQIAGSHHIPVTLLCDTNHVLRSDYSEVIVVGAGLGMCIRDRRKMMRGFVILWKGWFRQGFGRLLDRENRQKE